MVEINQKRVKISSRDKNLDFPIFQQIASGSYPSQIAKDLHISKQKVDYYISSLKARDLIQMEHQGVWKVLQNYKPKESKKSTRVATEQPDKYFDSFDPDTDRGHAFQFKLKIPDRLRNWNNEKREKALTKLGIEWTPLKHVFGGGERIIFRDKKVHLTNVSVIIYDKASYFAETSKKSQGLAMIKILYLVKALEHRLRASFSVNGRYSIRPTRQHHALIKNALAMLYNKPKRLKLEVFDERGLWLLIDNSFNLEELECVHPETSVENAEGIKGWMNSMKQSEFKVTPTFVLETMNGIQQNQLIFDKNMKSHLEVLNKIGDAVEKLAEKVENLGKKDNSAN